MRGSTAVHVKTGSEGLARGLLGADLYCEKLPLDHPPGKANGGFVGSEAREGYNDDSGNQFTWSIRHSPNESKVITGPVNLDVE